MMILPTAQHVTSVLCEDVPSFSCKKRSDIFNRVGANCVVAVGDTAVGKSRTPRTLNTRTLNKRRLRAVGFGLISTLVPGIAFAQMTTRVDLSAPPQLVAAASNSAPGPTMKLPPPYGITIIPASRQLITPRPWKSAPQTTVLPPIDLIRLLLPYTGPTMKIVPFPLAIATTQQVPK